MMMSTFSVNAYNATHTLAPFFRRISVMAFPIPIAAPVTTAILPLRAISVEEGTEKVSVRMPAKK